MHLKAPFSYDERRWFANRRRRPRGPKQQRPRGPRRRFANRRCCHVVVTETRLSENAISSYFEKLITQNVLCTQSRNQ